MSKPLTKDEEAKVREVAKGDFYTDIVIETFARLLATLDAERAESARLRALFEDAGQGAYDVLALVDHYQDLALVAEAKVARLRDALARLMACLGNNAGLDLEDLTEHDFDSVSDFERAREQLCAEVDAQRVLAETGGES